MGRALASSAIAAMLYISLALPHWALSAEPEYDLKAAFFYNFAKFTKWPPAKIGGSEAPFLICLIGKSPIEQSLRKLEGREALGKPVSIRMIQSPGDAAQCHMLFVGDIGLADIDKLNKQIEGAGVLSVSDSPVCRPGDVGIFLFVRDNRVRFHLNPQRLRLSGVEVSSYLMELSTVYDYGHK